MPMAEAILRFCVTARMRRPKEVARSTNSKADAVRNAATGAASQAAALTQASSSQTQQQTQQRWCVLFSPSGVRSLLASARRPALDVKLLAIGETTLAALRACELGQRYDTRVCASPTPQGVLDAIAAG